MLLLVIKPFTTWTGQRIFSCVVDLREVWIYVDGNVTWMLTTAQWKIKVTLSNPLLPTAITWSGFEISFNFATTASFTMSNMIL